MKITPRSSLSLDYTPRQWVSLCNTSILLFVTFMFGLVVYNMKGLDQRLIRVLDSSAVAIDLIATDILQSQTTSYWRTVSRDLAIYSAFRDEDHHRTTGGSSVLLIGTTSRDVVDVDDLRCLVKYDGEDDDIGIAFVDYRKPSNCSGTVFLYCRAKSTAIPKKVALVSDSSGLPKQWLEVRTVHRDVKRADQPTIAACVRPFSGAESAREVAEFVAFYETIGLSHFYFYNRNAVREVGNFALQLKGSGHSVNLLPWNKQEDPDVDQVCPADLSEHVQDCLHRAAGKFDFVFTVDVSEYAVPLEYFGLPALVGDYGDSSKLDMNVANFCQVPISQSKFDDRVGLKKMTLRGPMALSNFNYIIHPEPALPDYRAPNRTGSVRTLAGNEVLVHRHCKKCREKVGILDLSAYKYMGLVEEASLLQTFKRRSKDNMNQNASATT